MKKELFIDGRTTKYGINSDSKKMIQDIIGSTKSINNNSSMGFYPATTSTLKQPIPILYKYAAEQLKPQTDQPKLNIKRKSQTNLNPQYEKAKSYSMTEKSDKGTNKLASKYDYMQFIQNQNKKSRQKLVTQQMRYSYMSVQPGHEQQKLQMQSQLKKIKENMNKYYMQLQKKDEILQKKDRQIMQKNGKMNKMFQQIERLLNKQRQFQSLVERYNVVVQKLKRYQSIQQSYNELIEKYNMIAQQLNKINQRPIQLPNSQFYKKIAFLQQKCQQYQKKQTYYDDLEENIAYLSQQSKRLEFILQKKEQMLQNTITSKNNEYKSAIAFKNNEIKSLENRYNILEHENQELKQQKNQLQSKLTNMEYQIHQLNNEKSQLMFQIQQNIQFQKQQSRKSKIKPDNPTNIKQDAQNFNKLGHEFQMKINFYINQNLRLQNLINKYESQLQANENKVTSLQRMLEAYELRDKQNTSSRTNEQFRMLRSQLQAEKQDKDQLVSRLELQIMKLQNTLQYRKLSERESLMDLCDQQNLRQNLYMALNEIQKLKQRIQKWSY